MKRAPARAALTAAAFIRSTAAACPQAAATRTSAVAERLRVLRIIEYLLSQSRTFKVIRNDTLE